jgi:vancomycin resistance protein YoaR
LSGYVLGGRDRPADHEVIPIAFRGVPERLLARSVRAGILLLLVGVTALAAIRIVYAGSIYPGVIVVGVEIGGLSRDEARLTLSRRIAAFQENLITFSYAGRSWTPTLGELGVTVDLDAALDRAYGVGRDGKPRDRLLATAHLFHHDEIIRLELRLDEAMLEGWYSRVDREIDLPARDASLAIDGVAVAIVPDQEGVVVDRAAATTVILRALKGLSSLAEPLPMRAHRPDVRASDLLATQQALQKALSNSIELRIEQKSWKLAPSDLAPFVQQITVDVFTLDETSLAEWLSTQLGPEINREPVDAVVAWSIEQNQLISVEPSVDGVKLKPVTLARQVSAEFWGEHTPITVPVAVIKPRIASANLAALGITNRLGVGDSNYEGSSAARATNIEVGARLLNGTLVPPGGEFSFNHAVGIIDEEAGFVEAPVINGERFDLDIGGGICQVSTTVYRAALLAGLPITEWWPHLYRLAFYEQDEWLPGFDASILQPEGDPFGGGDFRFANPSNAWLLVESWADGDRIFVIIYGPDLDYAVNISEPVLSEPIPETEDLEIVDPALPPQTVKQTELAQTGLVVSYARTVIGANGERVLTDTWTTTYAPKGSVWTVSPDMEGQSPAA